MSFKPGLRRCLGAAFVVVLLGLLGGGPARAEESTLSLDEYWRQLEETRVSVARLEDPSSEAGRDQLLAWADRWERVTGVVLPDGTRVPLDHSRLVSALRADPPDPARLEALLSALLAARQSWPATGRDGSSLETLERVLAQPEFQWKPEEVSQLTKWWRGFWKWVDELLGRLLPEGGRQGAGDLLGYLLTLVGAVALGLVLAYVLRDLWADWVAEAGLDPDAGLEDEELSAATALKRAQLLSGEGDYRSAVRYLYLSSLLLLEERGLLRYDRSLTNREYLRSVAHLPQLAAVLRDVVEVFDRVWYGYQPLDDSTYARYAERVADLRRLP